MGFSAFDVGHVAKWMNNEVARTEEKNSFKSVDTQI